MCAETHCPKNRSDAQSQPFGRPGRDDTGGFETELFGQSERFLARDNVGKAFACGLKRQDAHLLSLKYALMHVGKHQRHLENRSTGQNPPYIPRQGMPWAQGPCSAKIANIHDAAAFKTDRPHVTLEIANEFTRAEEDRPITMRVDRSTTDARYNHPSPVRRWMPLRIRLTPACFG